MKSKKYQNTEALRQRPSDKKFQSPKFQNLEPSNILRNCYYNIGRMLFFFCLPLGCLQGISFSYISLWQRPKNFRFLYFTKNPHEFQEFEEKMYPRQDIEKRYLTFFGGKAAESLFIFIPLHKQKPRFSFLQTSRLPLGQFDPTFFSISNNIEPSSLGIEDDIQASQTLLKLMVEKWYFYLERIATEKFHPMLENLNFREYPYREREVVIGQAFVDEMMVEVDMRNRLSIEEQKSSYIAWWMKRVTTRFNYRQKPVLLWSRIYLSDPDNSWRNIEWSAPDEFYHTVERTPPFCMTWAHFLENGRFAVSNILLLQSFNTAFRTLRPFSEFMDFLADSFLRYEFLREIDFQNKIYQFFDSFLFDLEINEEYPKHRE